MTQAFGRYTLHQHVASGGMAEIYLASQTGPAGVTRELVVKRVLPELAREPRFVEMFLDEARVLARLSHPNLVAIYDFGQVDGTYYIAMERVLGPSLREIGRACARQQQRLTYPLLARIIAGAAEGLEHAHRLRDSEGRPLNIVHRDISPSNILVSYDGVPKVLDFGIAKAATSTHKTRTGVVKGKLAYMPPEQILGDALDARADVYALGVVMYQFVAGRKPFADKSEYGQMQLIIDGDCPRPSQLNPQTPPALEQIILRAMAKDREQRYASARELACALDGYISAEGPTLSSFDLADAIAALEARSGERLAPAGLILNPSLDDQDLRAAPPDEPTAATISSQISQPAGPAAQAPGAAPADTGQGTQHLPRPGSPARVIELGDGDLAPAPAPRRSGVSALVALLLVVAAGVALLLSHSPAQPIDLPETQRSRMDLSSPLGEDPEKAAAQSLSTASALPPAQGSPSQAPASPSGHVLRSKAARKKKHRPRARRQAKTPASADDPPLANAVTPAPAADPKEPEPAVSPGEVVVLVHPYGEVRVDGRSLGRTPIAPVKLSPGPHQIEIRDRASGRVDTRAVVVRSGQRQVIRVKF